jgi:hypothetical protein
LRRYPLADAGWTPVTGADTLRVFMSGKTLVHEDHDTR